MSSPKKGSNGQQPTQLDQQVALITEAMQSIVQLYQQGQYEQALNMAFYYFHLARQQLGEQHPLFLASLENLATLYRETGNFTAAEPLYLQLLQI